MHQATTAAAPQTSRLIANWLFILAALVCAIIVVGGATRLTDSGLSITEWRPVTGALPPMSDAHWQEEFDRYRQIPQYQEINRGMSLGEFQFIYWWEWGHRQLGRLIGLVMLVPLAAFWATGRIPARLKAPLVGLLLLIGLQGAVGWWMVASGLSDRVSVSQYRLATHLGLAFVILGAALWLGLSARYGPAGEGGGRWRRLTLILWAAVLAQIILGAFVAGLHAGRILTTWPGFDGRLVPEDYLSGLPWLQAMFESRAAVQLHHRWAGYALAAFALIAAFIMRRAQDAWLRRLALALALVVLAQAALGVITLVNAAPLNLSLVHQGGAIAVFLIAGSLAWRARRVS
ncbi:MAG: COX15/CtaA family protein [Maricaulaceae bacterium]|nr:COX15/CtaA family protein [Maricaulaceae bacterium]